jgi:hypothetical protein
VIVAWSGRPLGTRLIFTEVTWGAAIAVPVHCCKQALLINHCARHLHYFCLALQYIHDELDVMPGMSAEELWLRLIENCLIILKDDAAS